MGSLLLGRRLLYIHRLLHRLALDFLILVIRTIVYFNPLKVFIPLGSVFFALGFTKFIYDVYIGNFSETALLGFLGAVLIWGFGLLSDQISRVALRPNNTQ